MAFNLERTPPKSSTSFMVDIDNARDAAPPSGRLGVVTRKQNEIERIYSSQPNDTEAMKGLFTEFLSNVELLQTASMPTHIEWLNKHLPAINAFREKFNSILYPPPPSVRARSVRSASSSSSSLRSRVIERKAKLQASKEAEQEARRLEDRERQLKIEYEANLLQVRRERENQERRAEEREIEILERESQIINDGASEAAREDVPSAPIHENIQNNSTTNQIVTLIDKQTDIYNNITQFQKHSSLPQKIV